MAGTYEDWCVSVVQEHGKGSRRSDAEFFKGTSMPTTLSGPRTEGDKAAAWLLAGFLIPFGCYTVCSGDLVRGTPDIKKHGILFLFWASLTISTISKAKRGS